MWRILSIALVIAAQAAPAAAQTRTEFDARMLDRRPRYAGSIDLATGRFHRAGPHAAIPKSVSQTIYNNTITWSGGSYYLPTAPCDLIIDEGVVPSSGGTGMSPLYAVDSITFGYVTFAPTGTVDIDIALFDTNTLPDPCGTTTAYAGQVPIAAFVSSASGFPLPGATSTGVGEAWIVAFETDCIPMHGGTPCTDLFHWSFRSNNTATQGAGNLGGPLIAGEPTAPVGSGTFTIPPAIDPVYGTPAGHGLCTKDSFWIEVDSTGIGGTPPAGCSITQAGLGTNCYTVGGYPNSPFASFYFKLTGNAAAANVTTYCTSKVSKGNCVPTMSSVGTPSSSAGSGFMVSGIGLDGQRLGRIHYGLSGRQANPFVGGWLCVAPPVIKLPIVNSGGTSGTCSGSIGTDFNTLIASGSNPMLTCGVTIDAQVHFRDYITVWSWNIWNINFGLTNAIEFTIEP